MGDWSYSASAFRAIASRSCNHPNSRYSHAPPLDSDLDGWHETHAQCIQLHVALTGRPVNGDIVSRRAAAQCLAATEPGQSHDRTAHVSGTSQDTIGGCEQGVALSDLKPKMAIEGHCPISSATGRIWLWWCARQSKGGSEC
jgi:hypothetical protein